MLFNESSGELQAAAEIDRPITNETLAIRKNIPAKNVRATYAIFFSHASFIGFYAFEIAYKLLRVQKKLKSTERKI